MEQMKEDGFSGTYTMTLVQDKKFYSGSRQDGIYAFFRGTSPIHGVITKPTGKKDEQFFVNGCFVIRWQQCNDMKFYVVEL